MRKEIEQEIKILVQIIRDHSKMGLLAGEKQEKIKEAFSQLEGACGGREKAIESCWTYLTPHLKSILGIPDKLAVEAAICSGA